MSPRRERLDSRKPRAELSGCDVAPQSRIAQFLDSHATSSPWIERDRRAATVFLVERVADGEALDRRGADVLLALGCALGDDQALRRFETEVLRSVRRLVRRVDPRPELADEILQRVRMTLLVPPAADVLPKIARYRAEGSLLAWVTTTAVRLALAHRAGERGSVALGDDEATAPDGPPSGVTADELLAFREGFRLAVADLDAEQCMLLHAFYVEGRPLEDLARALDMSRATASRRLAAARGALRARVDLPDSSDDLGTLADAGSIRRLLVAGTRAAPGERTSFDKKGDRR